MKKIIILGAAIALFSSCKSAMENRNNTAEQAKLKGEWILESVQYSSAYKISPFYIADAKCFENSEWKFVSNNNTGTISLNPTGVCPDFSTNFVWNIKNNGNFNLKFIGDEKAKEVTSGFTLKIDAITETSFKLIDNSTETPITYTFRKK